MASSRATELAVDGGRGLGVYSRGVRNGMRGEIVLEFVDARGAIAARVSIPERAMFWSDGRFEPGEAFDAHRELFDDLEAASRRFQSEGSEPAELERAWRELNERFEIRRRGERRPLKDVGLHLDGARASVRY